MNYGDDIVFHTELKNTESKDAFDEWYKESTVINEDDPVPFSFFAPNGSYWEGCPSELNHDSLIVSGKWYPPSKLRPPLRRDLEFRAREQSPWEFPPSEYEYLLPGKYFWLE